MKSGVHFRKHTSLKPEDIYKMKFIGNINVVAGKILFEVAEPDRKNNDYLTGIYQLNDGRASRFTRGERDSGIVINNEGNLMAYLSKNLDKSEINIKDLSTSSDYKLTEENGRIVKMVWDRNSKGLYLIIERKKEANDFHIIENIPIYSDGKGFLEGFSYEIIHVNLKGKPRTVLTTMDEIRDFALNPVKEEIALGIRPLDSDDYHSRVGILSLTTGKITYLTTNAGDYINQGLIGGITSMEYFDDGTLAFLMNRKEFFIEEAPEIVFWKDGHLNEVMRKNDISPGIALGTDSAIVSSKLMRVNGRYLYFIATVRGRAGIYRVNDEGYMSPVVTGDFSVESFDFKDDAIYFIAEKSNSLPGIYKYDGKISFLFSMNKKEKIWNLKKPENFYFTASDGVEIEAWILKGRGKGTIVMIHGGPRGAFGEALVFEAHLLNSIGFSVVYCNPRGSDSYGDEFAAAVVRRYGERDYNDVMEMVDYCVKRYRLDPRRLGVMGGSYGGFMVNWMVGHTDIFKAAVSDRSFADLISDYFSGDIGPTFDSDQIGGTPYDNIETYWEKSPIKHIQKCKTPILLIQSDSDYRCPVWQAYELFTQLKLQGSVTKLVIFKGENHNMTYSGKPRNRVKRLEEIAKWFEMYLK